MIKKTMGLMQRVARRYTRVPVDSTRHPAEQYYAQIYLDEIRKRLAEHGGEGLRVLDAGCGSGRIMVPISQLGHHFTGIDYHRDSLRMAKENLDAAGTKAELIEKSVLDALVTMEDNSFDAVFAIESIYVDEQYDTILKHMARVLRPGGLMFISHRTRFFYLGKALAEGHFDDVALIARHNHGMLRKGLHRFHYNWQTRGHIERTNASLGLTMLSLTAIGVCSGFGSDPLTAVCDPGTLDGSQKKVLREVETCDDDLVMTGRYVLAVSRK